MLLFSYWFYTKMALAIILGFLVAYWLKKLIRVILTRIMPVQQRMADDFFNKLTFRSTIVGFILAIASAGGLYWAFTQFDAYFVPPPPPRPAFSAPKESITPVPPPAPIPIVEEEEVSPMASPQSPEETPLASYYLQIYAFRQRSSAEEQVRKWAAKTDHFVLLAYAAADLEPYKVLIGPFSDTASAKAFQGRQGLRKGFPRTLDQLDILSDE